MMDAHEALARQGRAGQGKAMDGMGGRRGEGKGWCSGGATSPVLNEPPRLGY